MDSDTVEGGPISQVTIGDRVVDSTGKEIGKSSSSRWVTPTRRRTKARRTTGWEFGGLRRLV